MKARIKETGEVVEINQCAILYDDGRRELMRGEELEEISDETAKMYDELDEVYWINLKHQYAGMAMQGLLIEGTEYKYHIPKKAIDIATALVEKLKEEKSPCKESLQTQIKK